jgi:hypothetical protein
VQKKTGKSSKDVPKGIQSCNQPKDDEATKVVPKEAQRKFRSCKKVIPKGAQRKFQSSKVVPKGMQSQIPPKYKVKKLQSRS